CNTRRGAFDLW
nr:immunoglobulin heavy chain junction region [Macaca mulatta]